MRPEDVGQGLNLRVDGWVLDAHALEERHHGMCYVAMIRFLRNISLFGLYR